MTGVTGRPRQGPQGLGYTNIHFHWTCSLNLETNDFNPCIKSAFILNTMHQNLDMSTLFVAFAKSQRTSSQLASAQSNSWCLIHHVSMSMENEREAAYSLLLGYKRPFKFKCHKGASCLCVISKIIKIAFVFVLCLC